MIISRKAFHAALLSISFIACNYQTEHDTEPHKTPQPDSGSVVQVLAETFAVLDSFNATAARADYNAYFALMSDDAVFMGTDATERWTKSEFMNWSKPFFDRGRAWSFRSIDRHIYFGASGKIAWFDELLDTQMKICRGSGVLVKEGDNWKIRQYVLSMTIPNSIVDTVVHFKKAEEDSVMSAIRNR